VKIPGVNYREYLIAGVFAQTVIFGATFTGAGLAEDMTKGIVDRFRSLPMSRSAVLIGRTASDIFYNSTSILVMSITGLIVGWRIRTSVPSAVGGFILLLAFAYAISWIMAFVGLKVASVEVVNNASFMFIFPLTFIANTFVRADFLPGPLKVFAEWNPVSSVAQAAREAFGNNGSLQPPDVWSLRNPVLYSIIWIGIILAIFVPLSIRQYMKAAAR
jgi:ABC transporter DrrB family efflux protein